MRDPEIKGMVAALRHRTARLEQKREVFIVQSEQEFVIKVRPIFPETHIRLSCPDDHKMRGARVEINGYMWDGDKWVNSLRGYPPKAEGYRLGVTYRFFHTRVPVAEQRNAPPIRIIIRGAPYGSRVFVSTH